MILALMSLVRITHPSMLRQDADGFTVDFGAIDGKPERNDSERLLLKLRPVIESAGDDAPLVVSFNSMESQLLCDALERLEATKTWPNDVVALSHSLRTRLMAEGHE